MDPFMAVSQMNKSMKMRSMRNTNNWRSTPQKRVPFQDSLDEIESNQLNEQDKQKILGVLGGLKTSNSNSNPARDNWKLSYNLQKRLKHLLDTPRTEEEMQIILQVLQSLKPASESEVKDNWKLSYNLHQRLRQELEIPRSEMELMIIFDVLESFKSSPSNPARDRWKLVHQLQEKFQEAKEKDETAAKLRRKRSVETNCAVALIAINVPPIDPYTSNLTRFDMLCWLNDYLGYQIEWIEELGRGEIYVSLMEVLFPGCQNLSKVKFKAQEKHEFIRNFKIVQNGFKRLGVDQIIPIELLVKCRFQENFEFVQWFKRFFEVNYEGRHRKFRYTQTFYHVGWESKSVEHHLEEEGDSNEIEQSN